MTSCVAQLQCYTHLQIYAYIMYRMLDTDAALNNDSSGEFGAWYIHTHTHIFVSTQCRAVSYGNLGNSVIGR